MPSSPVFDEMLAGLADGPPVPAAVVHPCSIPSLEAAVGLQQKGIVQPVLVGPVAAIRDIARSASIDLSGCSLIEAGDERTAASRGAALAREGAVGILMKGSLHSSVFLREIGHHDSGLRTDRRMSHVFVLDVPSWPRLLLLTDGAVNIAPDLPARRDIVQNAIDLAHVIGIARPRVAILSAIETVNPDLPSTLDAALLAKMAERGQISGGVVDGPLALDNALSIEAAHCKGVQSPVAGQADILVVPDLEAGNMLAKQMIFMGGASAAGIVLGARVPVVLTSRADSVRTRILSGMLAATMSRAGAMPAAP
ncbi:bifunctional enoyl-CoA hydratase/phosphate acetyltransferase [Gluconacetobacter tumulisoli]|uniref:Bifunctional enoyl-CoA hydratase/phosphate acetyltransferase n=1 Tax=Gluconacetobacter tumulisoli TaxID=1286189 RepID=A0A7W4PKB6_9PROT|nr:bifunctional enoyl-CoA hydratase/phosphate acetyltransferase [Gluconacetobacter tumulisoli]MBB2201232.1 bifunctional enoyl-CoA hydratase/phosphate acetyltransferase [Gluconacetobacter tumulisoli]